MNDADINFCLDPWSYCSRDQYPASVAAPRCYAADEHAPGDARLHVRAQLGVWRLMSLAEDVELATSELVANAVVHGSRGASDQVTLLLELTGRSVLVRVWDGSPAPPEPRSADPWAENGNGLLLVDSLSSRWGSYPVDGEGKVVWCKIDRRLLAPVRGRVIRDQPARGGPYARLI